MSTLLSTRAVLVSLTISCWRAMHIERVDPEVSPELDPHRTRLLHRIVDPHHPALRAIVLAADRLRRTHLRLTMPWDDQGLRLLAAPKLFDYKVAIEEARGAYHTVVREQLPALEAAIPDAFARYRVDLDKRYGTSLALHRIPEATDLPGLDDLVDSATRDYFLQAITDDTGAKQQALLEGLHQRTADLQARLADPDLTPAARAKLQTQHHSLQHLLTYLTEGAP